MLGGKHRGRGQGKGYLAILRFGDHFGMVSENVTLLEVGKVTSNQGIKNVNLNHLVVGVFFFFFFFRIGSGSEF